jgi:hypothetical protein
MQAPSAYHRQTFSIPSFPILSKRPSLQHLVSGHGSGSHTSYASSSSPRHYVKPISMSKILISALAVTASRSWVLNERRSGHHGGIEDDLRTGGAGWVILAFWSARIGAQLREEWRRRRKGRGKGKGKEREGQSSRGIAGVEPVSPPHAGEPHYRSCEADE